MKFTPTEVSKDGDNNVTVNGFYKDDAGKIISAEKAFQFDPTDVKTKEEFLAIVKKAIEAKQPTLTPEQIMKAEKADIALALLDGFTDKDITLQAVIEE